MRPGLPARSRIPPLVGGNGRLPNGGRRAGLAAGVLAAVVLLAALASPAASQDPDARGVTVATTGQRSEIQRTVPITRSAGAAPRVVMSLPPGTLPALMEGDRLRTSAEVQITADCTFQRPRCAGPPYRYSPVIRGTLILAGGIHVTGGPYAARLSGPVRNVCRQTIGDREHHCMLVPTGEYEVPSSNGLPCPDPGSCYINLVVDAHDRHADPGDVVVVGGQRPNGRILQDKGRINAVLVPPGSDEQASVREAQRRVRKRLSLDLRYQVVYSQKLEGLLNHEQLEIEATMATNISHLPYATRVGARLILAGGRHATRQGRVVKQIADLRGEISENNGFNCTQRESPCVTRKVGVMRMKQDAPGPLYINLVAIAGPKNVNAAPGDRVLVRKAGGLRVVRYPPEETPPEETPPEVAG